MTTFLSFPRWLTEARHELHAWLTPTGEFVPLNGKTHSDTVESVQAAFAAGWARVTYIGDELIANNDVRPLSRRQVAALRDAAIENGFTSVSFDDGEDLRVIWSQQDNE